MEDARYLECRLVRFATLKGTSLIFESAFVAVVGLSC